MVDPALRLHYTRHHARYMWHRRHMDDTFQMLRRELPSGQLYSLEQLCQLVAERTGIRFHHRTLADLNERYARHGRDLFYRLEPSDSEVYSISPLDAICATRRLTDVS